MPPAGVVFVSYIWNGMGQLALSLNVDWAVSYLLELEKEGSSGSSGISIVILVLK